MLQKIQLFYDCNNKTVHSDCSTTILLRRELWSPLCFILWNFIKHFKKIFETSLNVYIWQNAVKFTHLISKEVHSKCYAKYVFWKAFKKLYKTMADSISSNAANFFSLEGHPKDTCRALKGHLGTRRIFQGDLSTRKTLEGHSGIQGSWCTRELEGYIGTQVFKALENSGTQRNLGHSGTQSSYEHEALELLYLADSNRKLAEDFRVKNWLEREKTWSKEELETQEQNVIFNVSRVTCPVSRVFLEVN